MSKVLKVEVSSDYEGLKYDISGDTTIESKTPIRKSLLVAKDYFSNRDNLLVAEIGVHRGANAKNILEVLNPKLLLLVDNWDGYGETHNINFIETWYRLHGRREIIIIKGWSEDVAKLIHIFFDYIYIDAGHSDVDIRIDIKSWLPKLKLNGILAGHDYFTMPGVKMVVDETFGNKVCLDDPKTGSDWWIFAEDSYSITNI